MASAKELVPDRPELRVALQRLSRCDSLDAVLVEVHAAEDSALALTAVNMVTAVHRVAKLSSTARSLQFPEALLLLERIDNELTQVRILKSQDFSDIM